jgi:hypothetical protein
MAGIRMMNLNALDLSLVKIPDALLSERSVNAAGRRVGLSQPAASHAFRPPRAKPADRRKPEDSRYSVGALQDRQAPAGCRCRIETQARRQGQEIAVVCGSSTLENDWIRHRALVNVLPLAKCA